VWVDHDGDGRATSAFATAERWFRAAGADVPRFVRTLADGDEAVAAQAASLLRARGVDLESAAVRDAARQAGPHVERGFEGFRAAWRESQVRRASGRQPDVP
jgi:hypothetical protein